jgi:hypothetical protein
MVAPQRASDLRENMGFHLASRLPSTFHRLCHAMHSQVEKKKQKFSSRVEFEQADLLNLSASLRTVS